MASLLGICAVASDLPAQASPNSNWQTAAEVRLKAIFDRGEFRAKDFRPTWLIDSSGFMVEEHDAESGKTTQWFHDVRTGQRKLWQSESELLSSTSADHASHGSLRVEAHRDRLVVVDKTSQKETVLVAGDADRDVEYRNPRWSPDGAQVVFIEADYSEVNQRWVLVPGDPSYPEVQQHRFARVGGKIEKLRIGVVDADGQDLKWLAVECPEEGMYLGQVEWAGNSDELLVEKFSRFRDRRDFLLAAASGQVKSIYSETNDAWVESSQGKNSGLVWLKDGKEFVVVSEKDDWRHAWHYSREGKEVALLTPGDYDLIDRAIIDEVRGWYYFYASPENATQKYLYRVSLDGSGKAQRMTPENQPGTHTYSFSPDAFIRIPL
jgi:dipeptidyl-peptidase 4